MRVYDKTIIVKNAARCLGCGTVLESRHRHDYRGHSCVGEDGRTYDFTVDGGTDYIRRGWSAGATGRPHTDVFEGASIEVSVPHVAMGVTALKVWELDILQRQTI